MASPRDVLRMQADLRDRLENPISSTSRVVGGYIAHRYANEHLGDIFPPVIYGHIRLSRAYHVEDKMVDLILDRATHPDHFQGNETLMEIPPPFAMGWCVLGRPLELIEVRGRVQTSVAISWGPMEAKVVDNPEKTKTGRLVVFWTNALQVQDEVHDELVSEHSDTYGGVLRRSGGWSPTAIDFLAFDEKIGPARLDVPDDIRLKVEREGRHTPDEGLVNHWRILAALWELMSETLSTAHPEHLDRATLRWAKRSRISPDITVIKLRREVRAVLNPGSGTPLQYRVPVVGHNRTYHRGSPEEFTIWVSDHERGPLDAPYRANKKVYNLVR